MINIHRIKRYLEKLLYILLLFFVIPIKINKNNDDITTFNKYILDFNKTYTNNQTEYELRLQAFKRSLDEIEFLNSNKTPWSATYGLTKYSDLLPTEFFEMHLQNYYNNNNTGPIIGNVKSKRSVANKNLKLVEKIDWRTKNVVTPVRNQYNCGACYAFSTIETIESMHAIQSGQLQDLSIQQMIDCAPNSFGCNGGDVCALLRWMKMDNINVFKETDYPLLLREDSCRNLTDKNGVHVKDYSCNSYVSAETQMLRILSTIGPISVAINARTWQHYIGGIIQYHCNADPDNLNHAVQIVGYDLTHPKTPFYIVRNSWGADFGDEGYLYVAIGENLCGIANEVATLTVY